MPSNKSKSKLTAKISDLNGDKKTKKKLTSKTIESTGEKEATPRTAKIVLFVFGVGPLILMCLFLFSNGFFNTP